MRLLHPNAVACAICLICAALTGCQSSGTQLLRSQASNNAPQQPPVRSMQQPPAQTPPAVQPPVISIPAVAQQQTGAGTEMGVVQAGGEGGYFAKPWEEAINAGHEAFQSGDYQLASEKYQQALQQQPTHLNAQIHLARALTRLGQPKRAAAVYATAATQHPQSTTVRNDLAMLCANQGRLPEAVKYLQEAIRLNPRSPRYRANIARLLLELNRPEEAFVHLTAVNETAVAYYNMGVLYQQLGRWSEARRQFALALQSDPALAAARNAYAALGGTPAPEPAKR